MLATDSIRQAVSLPLRPEYWLVVTYHHIGESSHNQTRCPFVAHTRKVRLRADFSREDARHHVIRAGIPYGPKG